MADEKCLAKAKRWREEKGKTRGKAFSLIRFRSGGDAIRRSQQCEEKLFAMEFSPRSREKKEKKVLTMHRQKRYQVTRLLPEAEAFVCGAYEKVKLNGRKRFLSSRGTLECFDRER